MTKEKLNVQSIKTDLRNLQKRWYIELLELMAVFILFVAVLFWVPILLYKIGFGCFAIIMLGLIIAQVLDIIKLHKAFNNVDYIVKDKLVSKEIRRYNRIRNRGYCRLHFSGYGQYMIPDESYLFSTMFPLLPKNVYESSDYGDEFYLVLSKPHTGPIILVSNTKMFEFEI